MVTNIAGLGLIRSSASSLCHAPSFPSGSRNSRQANPNTMLLHPAPETSKSHSKNSRELASWRRTACVLVTETRTAYRSER
jgi:hypothetical protein